MVAARQKLNKVLEGLRREREWEKVRRLHQKIPLHASKSVGIIKVIRK
jgi:hypothetical protein